jgi:hypothetical protein
MRRRTGRGGARLPEQPTHAARGNGKGTGEPLAVYSRQPSKDEGP